MKDGPLPFWRVLVVAGVGMGLGALALKLLHSGQDPLLWACPLGAVLGARWAAGAGGTARWTALLASLVIWWGARWVLFRCSEEISNDPAFNAADFAFLCGGWCVLVWRSLIKLSHRALPPGVLPLALIGLFIDRLTMSAGLGLITLANVFGSLPAESFAVGMYCIWICLWAAALLCGLGSLCGLAGDLDIPWAKATSAAALLAGLMLVDCMLFPRMIPGPWRPWLIQGVFVLIESLWFLFWARRVVRARDLPPAPEQG